MTELATKRVRVRLFASARAVIGEREASVELDHRSATIADALDAVLTGGRVSASVVDGRVEVPANARAVLARCSFLVNGIATTDRGLVLADGDLIDVLPPFAGG